jgi:mono/diheme cytochrome c family protein/glucose/arabinose dehydrogenase
MNFRVTGWKQYAVFFLLLSFLVGCTRNYKKVPSTYKVVSAALQKIDHPSPVLSPLESLKHFRLKKGLKIKLVASEPLVQAPVTIKFDEKGRLWVIEMPTFMRDTTGTGEGKLPMGDIVILEDKDRDGMMDHRKVFMDSLVLPRAISFYKNGLLVAEPPKLLFVKNDHNSAGAITLVDSNYAVGGNVEHQPNGLLRGMDNWIYSANSNKRYRKVNGKWVIQHTHFRGQWGITQDDYGRLFYNNNSTNLLGDYFLPGLGAWNSDQKHTSGFNEVIVQDNRVYPIHPTPGVNRGYRTGVLDDSLRLNNFTAACSPLIYRGGVLGPKYEGNAFVAEPAGNLVKRDILWSNGDSISGKEAYQGKEFLASDDERFRPVDLKTGPDGALYVVDMYRGIIQDVTYITPYLKNQIEKRHLQRPLNRGRIYKIVPQGKALSQPDLSQKSTNELVGLLDDPNSWVRKTAQRLLVDGKKVEAENKLRQKIKSDPSLVGKIHAFWTLEGLGKLKKKDIEFFLQSGQSGLQHQAIAAAVSRMNGSNAERWIQEDKGLMAKNDKQLTPYIAFLAAAAAQYTPRRADDLLQKLALKYKNNPYVSDAVISGLHGREKGFLQQFHGSDPDTSSIFYHHLKEVVTSIQKRKMALTKKKMTDGLAQGKKLFKTTCQACHGADGNGIRSLGAPLNGSAWVTGNKQTLLSIVLYGLRGPVKIGNKMYRKPEVSGVMPSFGKNSQLSDKDVAQILSYIRSAWENEAGTVDTTDVKQARKAHKGRRRPFTMDELKQAK